MSILRETNQHSVEAVPGDVYWGNWMWYSLLVTHEMSLLTMVSSI